MIPNWLRNDYVVLTLIALLVLAMVLAPTALRAEPAAPDVECAEWAEAGPWTITRCEDAWSGEVCMMANSGFLVCRLD